MMLAWYICTVEKSQSDPVKGYNIMQFISFQLKDGKSAKLK